MTIVTLLDMPIGQRIGGGFVLTVKKTKKSVQLPSKRYIHTVVLFDNTGEMLADFKDPTVAGYSPLIKGQQVHIIVAEIQAAATSQSKVEQTGKKLFVDQYDIIRDIGDPDYFQGIDNMSDQEAMVKGKIRHGITCAYIHAGKEPDKNDIKKWTEFVLTGE